MRKSVESNSGRPVRWTAALLALWILVPASASFAMPVGGEKEAAAGSGLSAADRALIEERERMREEYRELRQKRLEALKEAVRETSGTPDGGQVPGWKPEATGAGSRPAPAPRRTVRTDSTAAPSDPAKAEDGSDPSAIPAARRETDHTVLVVVGCGVLLMLLLRILFPALFLNGFLPVRFRSRRQPVEKPVDLGRPAEHEAMTVTLRPRNKRSLQ